MATPRERARAWLMSVLTKEDGWKPIMVTNRQDASLLGQYAAAIEWNLPLSRFRGARVRDAKTGEEYRLITDPKTLDLLDHEGLLRGPGAAKFRYRRRWAGR